MHDPLTVLPIHLAFHTLGCVESVDGSVRVASPFGPWLEGLGDVVEQLTVVGYDPPSTPTAEDATDHPVRARRDNVQALSLGPKGTVKTYAERRRRVRGVVAAESPAWDVVVFRLPNRRADLVWRANRCPRVVTMIGGYGPSVVRLMPYPPRTKAIAMASALVAERSHRRMMRSAGLAFANSTSLAARYRRSAPSIGVIRTSSRREHLSHRAPDRFDQERLEVLVAGRISQPKGVFDALDAFEQIRRFAPSARLNVVGDGEALAELRARAAAVLPDDAVRFYGWISEAGELSNIFRRMDVLLMLSHAESFPRVVWDALAHSVLVVATPVGGLGSDLVHEREVLHVPVSSPSGAARAVELLAADAELRKKLLSNGFAASQQATVEHVVAQLAAALRRRWPEIDVSSSRSPTGHDA